MNMFSLSFLMAAAFWALAAFLPAAVWGQGTPLLRLTTIQVASGGPVQFYFEDQGTGATNYIVEFSPAVGGGAWSNITAAVVTPLGGGNYHVMAPDPLSGYGFYRVRGVGGPLFIPSDSWNGLPVIGDHGRAEREFKFTIHGGGLSDFNNAALATQIRLALAAAIGTVSWQAPPLVGFPFSPSPYQLGVPSNPVFLDIYYDSQEGVNYLSDTAYRFRMRFSGVDVIQGLQPERLEYQSHFDQTPFVDGFRTRTESRLELARNQSIAGSLDAFVRNAQSGLFESNVMAPSFGLVDFYRRRTQQDPRLVYLPNLVLETDRGRVHFTVDLTNLQIGVGVKEVFLVTMDTSRVYLAADYLPWLRREVPVKPDPLTVLNEVEVEFDRATSVPLDNAIARAQAAGDDTRLDQLNGVLNAFLADQRTVMDTILARFAEISRLRDDPNYLVCVPGVNSKYRQAFESVFFIRGDANFSGGVDN